jgi:hypothetical protein
MKGVVVLLRLGLKGTSLSPLENEVSQLVTSGCLFGGHFQTTVWSIITFKKLFLK